MGNQSQLPVMTELEKLSLRRGQFEGFNVTGMEFREQNGTIRWKISMWNNHNRIADYVVTGSEYRFVATHIYNPAAGYRTTIEIGPVVDPPKDDRKAVEAALEYWSEHLPPDDPQTDA